MLPLALFHKKKLLYLSKHCIGIIQDVRELLVTIQNYETITKNSGVFSMSRTNKISPKVLFHSIVIRRIFPNRGICHGGPISWPPRFPNVTPLNFFPVGLYVCVSYTLY